MSRRRWVKPIRIERRWDAYQHQHTLRIHLRWPTYVPAERPRLPIHRNPDPAWGDYDPNTGRFGCVMIPTPTEPA